MALQDLRRRVAFRDPLPRILILVEGEKTEVIYLEGVCRALRLTSVRIKGPAGVPKTMVETAASKKNDFEEIWCVFDVDIHPRLDEALIQARDNEIKVALSNPCFEIFLILHFELYTRPCDRDIAQRHLKIHIPDYDKSFKFDLIWPLFGTGSSNDLKLRAWHRTRSTEGAAPSTDVFELVNRLLTENPAYVRPQAQPTALKKARAPIKRKRK